MTGCLNTIAVGVNLVTSRRCKPRVESVRNLIIRQIDRYCLISVIGVMWFGEVT